MKKTFVALTIAGAALMAFAGPALAVNDPLVPGDSCAAPGAEAVGHPAFSRQPPQGANPPFSSNNPGESTGARGSAHSQAPCDT